MLFCAAAILFLFVCPRLTAQDRREADGRYVIISGQGITEDDIKNAREDMMQDAENRVKTRSLTGFFASVGQSKSFKLTFLISLNLLVLNLILLVISRIGTFEFPSILFTLNIGLLLFSLVPVLSGIVGLITDVSNYIWYLTFAGWFLIVLVYLLTKLQSRLADEKLLKRGNLWRCSKCKAYNDSIYVKCQKCDTDKQQ
jgi:hypothetical protein